MWSASGSITEAVLWFQSPPSPVSATVPLLPYTPLKACSPNTPSPNNPHMENCLTHTHTHMCLLMPPNSHIPCVSCTLTGCLKKAAIPATAPCVSLCSLFPSPEGVISDWGLLINSIKRVWLPRQIGRGYKITISASSAITMGHGSQMRVRLIGREDEVTLDTNWGKDWVCLCRGGAQYKCDFQRT